jgi:hypothetical protein
VESPLSKASTCHCVMLVMVHSFSPGFDLLILPTGGNRGSLVQIPVSTPSLVTSSVCSVSYVSGTVEVNWPDHEAEN